MEKNNKTIKLITLIALSGLLVSVCLLVFQGNFNVLRLDDFDYGMYLHNLNGSNINFSSVIKHNLDNVIWMRETWQGTYFALFLMKLSPLYFSSNLGGLSVFLIVISIILANYCYGKVAIKVFGFNKNSVLLLSTLLSLFQINCLPSPQEGLYWWMGGALYLFSYLYIAIILYCLVTIDKYKMLKLLIVTFFVFATEGSGWPCATLLVVILFFLTLYKFSVNDSYKYLYLYTFIIAGLFLFYAFSAPGNFVRKSIEVGASMPLALAESFIYSIVHLFVYFNSATLVILLIFAYFLIKQCDLEKIKYLGKKRCLFAYWCCYSSMFAPAIYGENYVAAPRYLNILFMMHIIFCLLIVVFIVVNFNISFSFSNKTLVIFILGFMYISGFFNYNYADPASFTVILDTINGTNSSFKHVMDSNFAILESDDKDVTITIPIKRPRLFVYEGLNYEWVKDDIMEYYGKDSVSFK